MISWLILSCMQAATAPRSFPPPDLAPRWRNAGLVYRPIGASGEPYPDWVRELKGKAGVYVIRHADSHEILYVGSSSSRLYDTLTRHFQQWRRYKGYWRGQYAEGHDRYEPVRSVAVWSGHMGDISGSNARCPGE